MKNPFNTFYSIVIESLNTKWDINREQLKKLPIYEKCFGFGCFKDESTKKEYIDEDGIKTITHTLIREEFSYAETLKPIDLKYLKNINWIFNLAEDKWNVSQRRVYNTLNPAYEIETSSKIFVCSNCKIETQEPDEINTKCEFHPNYIVNGNSVLYMCCGSYMPCEPCKKLDKHCWVIKN